MRRPRWLTRIVGSQPASRRSSLLPSRSATPLRSHSRSWVQRLSTPTSCRWIARSFCAIKVYNLLSVPVYNAIVAEAAEQQIPIMGHVPRAVGVAGAVAAHQKSLEHFSSFMRSALPEGTAQANLSLSEILARADLHKLPAIAEAVATAGSWTCPTVVQIQMDADPSAWDNERRVVPQDIVERYDEQMKVPPLGPAAEPFALALVRELHAKGAGLLLGTDAYKRNVMPGFSLLRRTAILRQSWTSSV